MEQNKRPHGREKKVSEGHGEVRRRGSGLGTGKVGLNSQASSSGGKTVKRAAAGGSGGILLLVLVALFLLNGKNSGNSNNITQNNDSGNISNSSSYSSNSAELNNSVANGSRPKRTEILGKNKDTVTLMVYMCGTDLESKHGMASADIEEMRTASKKFGDNFNLIIYTGGCNGWKNGILSSVNQIYQIKDGQLILLANDNENNAMTSPETLSSFIKYCNSNFPANRRELIMWDHGGGSVSGFGYDEKNKSAGSMDLAGISKALKDGGVTFDFIGFDACLMATAENALMLADYADYLIASEETEPGIGWYYTDWLKEFSKKTSQPTLDIGKNIIDDFVSECGRKCKGQKTTLSIIDLAEFSSTIPANLVDFSRSVSDLIVQDNYKEVSDARYAAREFAESSKIDQVDLVDLAQRMNTPAGDALAESLRSAVKYNRTSSNITNAYGVSIYFPYKRTSYVDTACSTYEKIGMDSEYANCIRQFAGIETSGQIAAGGTSSPISSLFGLGNSSSSGGSSDIIGSLINAFLGNSGKSIAGLDDSNTDYMSNIDTQNASDYIAKHYFDPTNLIWEEDNGEYIMKLPESQWELIHGIDMNMFYFDGEGYVDLGLDNVFSYNENGDLVADTEKNWIAINNQPVAYYHTDTIENENGSDTNIGYVPALLNSERVNLIIVFDGADGYIAGANTDYHGIDTQTSAKTLTELKKGDKLDFICDFYSESMEYQDSYYLGDQMTVSDNMEISNIALEESEVRIMYCFTDIYNQKYWSEAIIK